MTSTAEPRSSMASMFWENVRTIAYALLLAFGIRFWVAQPFRIPTASMEPTLLVGDYIVVTKWSYGYSRFSFAPLERILPGGRLFGTPPERGDIVVFRPPSQEDRDFVKRLVGMPGDTIRVREGALSIMPAGESVFSPVPRTLRADLSMPFRQGGRALAYEETLPNGVSYITYDEGPGRDLDNGEWRVPEGHYFMMGDNRDNSQDSRAACIPPEGFGGLRMGCVGFVPEENLVGPAQFVFVSFGPGATVAPWTWVTAFRASRFLKGVE